MNCFFRLSQRAPSIETLLPSASVFISSGLSTSSKSDEKDVPSVEESLSRVPVDQSISPNRSPPSAFRLPPSAQASFLRQSGLQKFHWAYGRIVDVTLHQLSTNPPPMIFLNCEQRRGGIFDFEFTIDERGSVMCEVEFFRMRTAKFVLSHEIRQLSHTEPG